MMETQKENEGKKSRMTKKNDEKKEERQKGWKKDG